MKKIIKIIKKVFLIALISVEIILLNIAPAQAELGSLLGGILGAPGSASPNANGMLAQMEERYHLNPMSMMDFGESFNVANQKQISPEVKMMFTPQKPKLGEKVTANAFATGFQDGAEDLYFVWYLKHKGCEEGSSNLALCDANDNGEVTVTDWMVEGMKINATNGFDSSTADYSSDSDNDGFCQTSAGAGGRGKATLGGNNNMQDEYRCYINDHTTGTNFEIASVEETSDETEFECGGKLICSSPYLISCLEGRIDVPYQDLGSASSSSDGGDGGDDGSGGSGGSSSSSVDLAVPAHSEHVTGFRSTGVTDSGYQPYCDPSTKKAVCPLGTTPRCIEDTRFIDPTCEFMTMIISAHGRYTTLLSNPGVTEIPCTTEVASEDSVEQKCGHLFPRSPFALGDGSFDEEEEKFWGTDPHKFSTAGNGKSDEENVTGLGADKLTWTYMPGDEIGVIVEGSSFLTTKHDDASKAITFALPKNTFQLEDSRCALKNQEKYVKQIKDYNVEIPVARIDLLECLRFNMVSPNNGDHGGKLETELSYSPKNPTVKGRGLNGKGSAGDSLVVTANTSNLTLDNTEVYYKWKVYGTTKDREDLSLLEGAEGGWTELSSSVDFRKNNGISSLEGLGMNEFVMQLDEVAANITHLRFDVELEEYYGEDSSGLEGTTSSGRADTIVKISNTGEKDGIIISVGSVPDICATSDGGACEVLNNQVLEASIKNSDARNFLWTLNGKKIEYLPNDNATKQGDTVKFLVQGKPGDTFLLSVLANDTSTPKTGGNEGTKINLSRNLVIVEPRIALGPNNELNRGTGDCQALGGGTSAPMGTYYDPTNGDSIPDCRETVFEASGSFDVPVTYYPAFIETEVQDLTFYVNGVLQSGTNIDLASYPEGSMVSVTVEGNFNPVTDAQVGELSNTWGVSHAEATNYQKLSDTIVIRVTAGDTVGVKKASKIIAGLAYNLPQQMIFIFRMMLTTLVIIFTAGVLMALTKKEYIK